VKKLADILYRVPLLEVKGNMQTEISGLCFDSRRVQEDNLFIAVRGTSVDGHSFINKSIADGATAIICEHLPEQLYDKITYVRVSDSAKALAIAAENFYENPSSKLKVVGVTGTNGKTTIVTLLHQLFSAMGYQCGLLSTIENKIGNKIFPSTHTTPDPLQISALMKKMVDEGCTHCFMEASSHAIDQQRVAGLNFTGAIFTNISHDHLDYHKTLKEYIKAKKKLFDQLSSAAFALINVDDKNGKVMVQNTSAQVNTYALQSPATFHGRIIEITFEGMQLELDGEDVHVLLVGRFNAYNLLAVYAAARLLNEEKLNVLTQISKLLPAEGRFDYVLSGGTRIMGIVDYAHTPDALEKVLLTIKHMRTGNESIITVVGCGGDRDKSKRPVMAKVASEMSDRLILTSDNPRSEDPQQIIDEMKPGIIPHKYGKTLFIADRKEAIRTAVSLAHEGDIILLAGKGHEKYQEVKGTKIPFDDKAILKESFQKMSK
jgi:UDP-N-acetylmuramoyl-L-alanyl-D-glutamate--2,6-diaminopimelate ligase